MRLLYALWSIIAWSYALVAMITLLCICLPLSLLVPFQRWQGGAPAAVMRSLLHVALARLSVRQDPGFDRERVSVFVMNHTSMGDGFVGVAALPHPFCGIENASHLAVPGYGWLMRLANAIPVRAGASNRTAQLLEAALDRKSRGISILGFPEGHRTLDGRTRPFRRGIFFMAREAGLPIVPVAVRGMYEFMPKGRWTLRPAQLDVYIGPQVETAGLSDAELEALAQRSRAIIDGWLERHETVNAGATTAKSSNRDEPLAT